MWRPLTILQDDDDSRHFELTVADSCGWCNSPSMELLIRAAVATGHARFCDGELQADVSADQLDEAVGKVLHYFDCGGSPDSSLVLARKSAIELGDEFAVIGDCELAWALSKLREKLADESQSVDDPLDIRRNFLALANKEEQFLKSFIDTLSGYLTEAVA